MILILNTVLPGRGNPSRGEEPAVECRASSNLELRYPPAAAPWVPGLMEAGGAAIRGLEELLGPDPDGGPSSGARVVIRLFGSLERYEERSGQDSANDAFEVETMRLKPRPVGLILLTDAPSSLASTTCSELSDQVWRRRVARQAAFLYLFTRFGRESMRLPAWILSGLPEYIASAVWMSESERGDLRENAVQVCCLLNSEGVGLPLRLVMAAGAAQYANLANPPSRLSIGVKSLLLLLLIDEEEGRLSRVLRRVARCLDEPEEMDEVKVHGLVSESMGEIVPDLMDRWRALRPALETTPAPPLTCGGWWAVPHHGLYLIPAHEQIVLGSLRSCAGGSGRIVSVDEADGFDGELFLISSLFTPRTDLGLSFDADGVVRGWAQSEDGFRAVTAFEWPGAGGPPASETELEFRLEGDAFLLRFRDGPFQRWSLPSGFVSRLRWWGVGSSSHPFTVRSRGEEEAK